MKHSILTFHKPIFSAQVERPIISEDISAGFPSPAEDFKELRISLDKALIKNPDATFYARVRGNSMSDAGIEDDDLLVIDKSIEAKDGMVAVCMIDGDFTIKRLKVTKECIFLMPEKANYKPIKITEGSELIIWGIVTYVIKKV